MRVKRGPREDDGRWYWRADRAIGQRDREDIWVGWGTREEAEQAVVMQLANHDPYARAAQGQLVTVRDLMETWVVALESRGDVSDYTKKFGEGAAKRIVRSGLRDVRLERLDRAALERHRDAELRSGAAPSTLKRDLGVLRQAWRWARELGQIDTRDFPSARIVAKGRVYNDRTPSHAEIVQAIRMITDEWSKRCVQLPATTGARIGEAWSLTWSQVALDGSVVRLEGKTGGRELELHPSMVREIQTWERGAPDEPVFGDLGRQSRNVASNRVNRNLEYACRDLGIPKFTANGLRRAMTDALYRTGAGADLESAITGHSPEVALRHYRRVAQSDIRRAFIQAGVGLPSEDESGQVIELRRGSGPTDGPTDE